MRQYLIKRLLLLLPTWILVSIIIFTLMRIVPGDYAALKAFGGEGATGTGTEEIMLQLRQNLGLDQPLYVQYGDWIWRMVRYGDMGISFSTKRPVAQEIMDRFPVTLELAVGTTIFSLLIAIPVGVLSAVRQDTPADYIARVMAIGGLSMPGFWIGTMLIVLPALWFGYLPPMGYVSPFVDLGANLQQFLFPSLALGATFAGTSMRMTRSQMLEVLRQDYVRTAAAKGLRERTVIVRHALKNAMIPIVSIVGLDFGYLIGRTVVIESVFVLPGLGSSTLRAVTLRDYPQVQGNILFIATVFVLINLTVDATYAWFNPQIRYQ